VTIMVVFGHAGGAYSQLMPVLGRWGYQITNGVFVLRAFGKNESVARGLLLHSLELKEARP
jgi:hypothetical protein